MQNEIILFETADKEIKLTVSVKNNTVSTRLNVHNDMVTIYRATAANGGGLNGDILKADGTDFTTEEIPFGKQGSGG